MEIVYVDFWRFIGSMCEEEITRLLNKYSTKQLGERWSQKSEIKRLKMVELDKKLKLFDGINSEYFRLQGTQKDRVVYLIKKINFNDVCPRCSSEQVIVLICYYVKCEYYKRFNRMNCRKVFKAYEVSDNLVDRFMLYLARYGINNTILDSNIV